jgi:hypothetical protein
MGSRRLPPKIGLVDVHEGVQAIRTFPEKLLTTLKQEKIFPVALLPGMAHQLNRC